MKKLLKYQWLTILWALFIFILCSIKLGSITQNPIFFPGFDKLVHCGFYFVFVVFYCNGAIRQNKLTRLPYIPVLIALIISVIFGGGIELLQLWVFTWRDGEWGDLFADTVGACMGAFSVLITFAAVQHEKK